MVPFIGGPVNEQPKRYGIAVSDKEKCPADLLSGFTGSHADVEQLNLGDSRQPDWVKTTPIKQPAFSLLCYHTCCDIIIASMMNLLLTETRNPMDRARILGNNGLWNDQGDSVRTKFTTLYACSFSANGAPSAPAYYSTCVNILTAGMAEQYMQEPLSNQAMKDIEDAIDKFPKAWNKVREFHWHKLASCPFGDAKAELNKTIPKFWSGRSDIVSKLASFIDEYGTYTSTPIYAGYSSCSLSTSLLTSRHWKFLILQLLSKKSGHAVLVCGGQIAGKTRRYLDVYDPEIYTAIGYRQILNGERVMPEQSAIRDKIEVDNFKDYRGPNLIMYGDLKKRSNESDNYYVSGVFEVTVTIKEAT
jgi:hypothetical protein